MRYRADGRRMAQTLAFQQGPGTFAGGFLSALWLYAGVGVLPSLVALGSLIVPLTLLFFFFECNTFRNISLLSVLRYLLLGSCLSVAIVFALTYGLKLCEFLRISVPSWMGLNFKTRRPYGSLEYYSDSFMAIYALFEKLGKGLIVLLFLRQYKHQCFVLPSMLVGAAVGAGFAVFESAGNTLEAMQSHPNIVSLLSNQLMTPVCHVAWGALLGGGIAMLSKKELKAKIRLCLMCTIATVDMFHTPNLWCTEFS